MRRGYTTTELLVYLTLFVVLSFAVVQTIVVLARSYGTIRTNASVTTGAQDMLERVVREIRASAAFDEAGSVFNSSPGKLLVRNAATSTEFSLVAGAISMKENGVIVGQLSSQNLVVDSLVFRKASSTKSVSVQVQFSLYDARAASSTRQTFFGTGLLRGGY